MKANKLTMEFLLSRSCRSGEHLLWTGSIDNKGYGYTYFHCKRMFVHRAMWTLLHGPIPEGHDVDHICFVTDCFEPSHLQVLTASENRRRQRTYLSDRCKHGHLFDEANTYRWSGNTQRYCRKCNAMRVKQSKDRKRATEQAAQS